MVYNQPFLLVIFYSVLAPQMTCVSVCVCVCVCFLLEIISVYDDKDSGMFFLSFVKTILCISHHASRSHLYSLLRHSMLLHDRQISNGDSSPPASGVDGCVWGDRSPARATTWQVSPGTALPPASGLVGGSLSCPCCHMTDEWSEQLSHAHNFRADPLLCRQGPLSWVLQLGAGEGQLAGICSR